MATTYSKPRFDNTYEAFNPELLASQSIVPHRPPAPLPFSLDGWRYEYAKRAIDLLLGATMLLAFVLPGILIAALIGLTSAGSVFYREERIGRNGAMFRIWKFRTMYANGRLKNGDPCPQESAALLQWRMMKHLPDPRITPVGRILRSWSLDEIPQLINVLRGEMSLVGPRPIVQAETGFYADALPFYLAAAPGLSGLWQVSGRCCLDYAERVAMDARYVANWSLSSDLFILLRTLPAVISRDGAH
jgi:exopolysaccharide production protein ExoY